MASAGRMCCRLIERNSTRHPFTYGVRNTAKENNLRWYSSATQKENEVELSHPRKNFDAVQKNIAGQVNHLYGSWQVTALASYDVPLHNFWKWNVTRPGHILTLQLTNAGQTYSLFQDVHGHKSGPVLMSNYIVMYLGTFLLKLWGKQRLIGNRPSSNWYKVNDHNWNTGDHYVCEKLVIRTLSPC